MKERVVIAMSGGVDSSVAAVLLKKKGYEVIGMTMRFSLRDSLRKKSNGCVNPGVADAQKVARKLGIRHRVLNIQKILEERVIKDFCQEYLKGKTPNPCIRCNQYIKFDVLLKKAISLGAQYLATGHYARVVKTPNSKLKTPNYLLKKAKDLHKDQSYFLYRLGQRQLKHILFPLGNYTKIQVRKLAKKWGLPVADKLASQEICFLPQLDYRRFLKRRMNKRMKPGPIVDNQGNLLGQHKGIPCYTIGQREGLGIAKGYPLYVTKIDPKNNKIFVGKKEDASKREFLVKKIHFILRPIKKKVAVEVKIRYNHTEVPAEVMSLDNGIKVCFREPQFAITPGQSAVFYNRDIVLGGGIIDRVLD